jgi:protein transport protein SEC31
VNKSDKALLIHHSLFYIVNSVRFNCLAWGEIKMHADKLPMGVIAGGMANGAINLWDPVRLLRGEAAGISSFTKHKGGVQALQFNPHSMASQLLASGSSDCDVFISDISRYFLFIAKDRNYL